MMLAVNWGRSSSTLTCQCVRIGEAQDGTISDQGQAQAEDGCISIQILVGLQLVDELGRPAING